ncbi:unnamed protein product [Gordionus sp. m RMFG-2023]
MFICIVQSIFQCAVEATFGIFANKFVIPPFFLSLCKEAYSGLNSEKKLGRLWSLNSKMEIAPDLKNIKIFNK